MLRMLLDHIIEHQTEICRLCSVDSGKTMADRGDGRDLFRSAKRFAT